MKARTDNLIVVADFVLTPLQEERVDFYLEDLDGLRNEIDQLVVVVEFMDTQVAAQRFEAIRIHSDHYALAERIFLMLGTGRCLFQ